MRLVQLVCEADVLANQEMREGGTAQVIQAGGPHTLGCSGHLDPSPPLSHVLEFEHEIQKYPRSV